MGEHDALLIGAIVTAILSFAGVVFTVSKSRPSKEQQTADINHDEAETGELFAKAQEEHLIAYTSLLEAWRKGEMERIEMSSEMKLLKKKLDELTDKVDFLESQLEKEIKARYQAENERDTLRERLDDLERPSNT